METPLVAMPLQNEVAGEPEFDWDRWIPIATKQPLTEGYFKFGEHEGLKDSTAKRIRRFLMAGMIDWLAKSGQLNGNVAECGCYLGHSSFIIATILKHYGFSRRFHIFDSFEGLSDASTEDVEPLQISNVTAAELHRMIEPKDGKRRFHGGLERVRKNLAAFDFIDFHSGWIPERFGEVEGENFSFVNIDVDLYEPTLASLIYFWPRLDQGGAIFVDDYGVTSWPGCTRAVDLWLAQGNTPRMALPIPGVGLILVK